MLAVRQPFDLVNAEHSQHLIEQARCRMHQSRERNADGDGAEHGREIDQALEVRSRTHILAAERDGQQHSEHDLDDAGPEGVDEGMADGDARIRLAEERLEVLESDELGVDQIPARQGEVERGQRRDRKNDAVDQQSRRHQPIGIRPIGQCVAFEFHS